MAGGARRVREGLGTWWRGRFGRRLLVEALLLFSLLTLYRLGRYLGRNQVDAAFDHARDILQWERALGIDNERQLQVALLDHMAVIRALNRYYAMVHFPATVVFIAVLYARAAELYSRIRLIFISVTAVALAMQILYPLAPPRMLPGFVDTIARYGPAIYERPGVESVANQYAAMPSLHVGWALIIAYAMWKATERPWRWIGVAHIAITVLAVVATANHYWLDARVAFALVGVAVRVVAVRQEPAGVPVAAGVPSGLDGGAPA
jgi:hypothetical protein